MLKITITALFVLALFSGHFTNTVNGEFEATLWVPEEILYKEKYQGLIVIETNTSENTIFDIITNNEEVLKIITESIVIPKGKHHGLIEFETIGTGSAIIFAISQDVLLESPLNVKESANTPIELDLILPSDLVNVLVDENTHTGYVFLINDFDNPVAAKQRIPIVLTNNGDIELPTKSLTIESGEHYVKFQFQAQGEGSISASAQNLSPDEEEISLDELEAVEIKIGVGPDPIPTESSGEIYFWLERDGKPYIPSHDVKVTISIDKSANLSFDSAMKGAIVLTPNTQDRRTENADAREIITRTEAQLAHDSQETFTIEKGNHYGRLTVYSSFDSAGDISISGLAESVNPGIDEETIKVSNIFSTNTESSTDDDITTDTQIFAFPDPAYKTVEIIVSSSAGSTPVMERNDEEFNIFTDNKIQLERNFGIIKSDTNYEIIKARIIDSGSATIFAERNEASSKEITLETSGKYVKNPELNIVALPIIFNTEQDLFLISSSQDKIVVDVNEEGNLISITSRPSFDFEITRESESVITINGKISELLDENPIVHVASNAFTIEENLEIYNPERKILISLHPTAVYPEEPFPIVNHIDDTNSNTVKKSILKVSSIADMGSIGELFYFNQTGTHDIIFYDKNSVPIKSTITVKGAPITTNALLLEEEKPTVTTYEVIVHDGQGSGKYQEDDEITISAPAIKDDFIIIKKTLVGWENLSYKNAEVTFEIDEEIETRPIYQDDYTILFLIGGSVGGGIAFVIIKKRKNGNDKGDEKSEDEKLLELLNE